ncbi:MAG: hypothetical protein AB8B52_05975 [Winogradskyella sp.]|uniref:hypothetical protein n=1 Tax=Winogradskyella sp. TaxID=1883156 RepID=UPI0038593720
MLKRIVLLSLLVSLVFSCDKDDELIPVCATVTNITSNSITNTSAVITWEMAVSSATYTLEYGVSGFTLGSGTRISITDATAQLTNLQGSTTYDVYIQTDCSLNNSSDVTNPFSFTTEIDAVVAELRPTLSEINLFVGNLKDLQITPYGFEYKLSTPLFTDYAHKQRTIALPEGTSMEFDGDGLPIFPENTVIAKTFFYNFDERDLSLGRQIIETRLLILINGTWETGDYKWNESQTEAVLDLEGSTLPITWVDAEGISNSITYKIPSNTDCFTCHSNNNVMRPIGPKLRTMNFDINGVNQLEQFIANQHLTGLASSSFVRNLPNWEDTSLPLEMRARAYMDINCAHCHITGGTCDDESTLNFAFETTLEDTNIASQTFLMDYRINALEDGIRMPFIGTSILHTEGVALINEYLATLD